MRHETAAQLSDGGWHYVSMSSRGGHPLGYCAEHEPHGTELEARECFAQYRRDHVTLDGTLSRWSDCRECGGPSKSFASVQGDGYNMAPLCEEHLTLELAIKHLSLDGPTGDAWVM